MLENPARGVGELSGHRDRPVAPVLVMRLMGGFSGGTASRIRAKLAGPLVQLDVCTSVRFNRPYPSLLANGCPLILALFANGSRLIIWHSRDANGQGHGRFNILDVEMTELLLLTIIAWQPSASLPEAYKQGGRVLPRCFMLAFGS